MRIVPAPSCRVPGCGGCLPGPAWLWVYCYRCRPTGHYPYINRAGRLVRRPRRSKP